MKTYTIKIFDRVEGRKNNDHILCRGVKADSSESALEQVTDKFNIMPGDGMYAVEQTSEQS